MTEAEITLSVEQEQAVEKVINWYGKWTEEAEDVNQVFQFTGYAGTGKTTTLKEVVRRLGIKPVYGAYTGKAALVMRQVAGLPAQTIHSMIYEYVGPDKKKCEELYSAIHDPDGGFSQEELSKMKAELKQLSAPRFKLNEKKDFDKYDMIVLDECSMVNRELLNDLLKFGLPILALGDPGQLPPVDGAGALFVGEPDVKLEKIHRQAEGNPIIEAATKARRGIPWPVSGMDEVNPDVEFQNISKRSITLGDLKSICLSADQLLTGKNNTRMHLNTKMREWKGFDISDPFPQAGETICCWRNDKELKLFNGMLCEVVKRGEIYDDYVELFIRTELMADGDEPMLVKALSAYFDRYYDSSAMERVKGWQRKNTQEFDFGYALTVHKSQGSQWDNVLFYDDGLFRGWPEKAKTRRQLLYTAITRASKWFRCVSG